MIDKEKQSDVEKEGPGTEKDGSIFSQEIKALQAAELRVAPTRQLLFVLAAVQVGLGLFKYYRFGWLYTPDMFVALGLEIGLGFVFAAMAITSFRKAALAFLVVLIVFPLESFMYYYLMPVRIGWDTLFRFVILTGLIRGYRDARELQQLKDSFGNP